MLNLLQRDLAYVENKKLLEYSYYEITINLETAKNLYGRNVVITLKRQNGKFD